MPVSRPLLFVLACLAVWAVHLGLYLANAYALWPLDGVGHRYGALVELLLILVLGALLAMLLPRALRWRTRRSARPSAELQQERQRIARDLHDHVGSQLVNAMALLDAQVPPQRDALRLLEQCLLDLRLVVDSMEGGDDTLTGRLARLRHRMLPVLQRRGVAMDWSVDCPEGMPAPQGEAAQHLSAIAQEALSNVLQHAQARKVAVRLACEGSHWCLEVRDDGVGGAPEEGAPAAGHGIPGMRRRAQLAGGRLSVLRPPEGGTCVRVLVPHAGAMARHGPVLPRGASAE